jgi:hypothetical protein
VSVPAGALEQAKAAYEGIQRRERLDAQLHSEVDRIKSQLRHLAAGRQKSISGDALNALSYYAILENVTPADDNIRASAEATLQFWRDEYGVDEELTGPTIETAELIARYQGGIRVDGWLHLTERESGRSERVGFHRISSRAIFAAMEILLPYCSYRLFVRRAEGAEYRASACTRFFYDALTTIDDRVTLSDVITVLTKHLDDLRAAHNVIIPPRDA